MAKSSSNLKKNKRKKPLTSNFSCCFHSIIVFYCCFLCCTPFDHCFLFLFDTTAPPPPPPRGVGRWTALPVARGLPARPRPQPRHPQQPAGGGRLSGEERGPVEVESVLEQQVVLVQVGQRDADERRRPGRAQLHRGAAGRDADGLLRLGRRPGPGPAAVCGNESTFS